MHAKARTRFDCVNLRLRHRDMIPTSTTNMNLPGTPTGTPTDRVNQLHTALPGGKGFR